MDNGLRIKRRGISNIAIRHGWYQLDYQPDVHMVSFVKKKKNEKPMRINIYLTTMTVATALDHPRQGKTQLYRKNVSLELLEEIFINPRTHTDKGYKRKI